MPTTANRLPRSFALLLAMAALSLSVAASCVKVAAAADVDDILPQLRQITKEEAASCERLLERAAPVVAQAYIGKPWNEVEASLKAAGATIAQSGENDSDYRCVVLPAAWSAGWGVKMDLYVRVSVSDGRPRPTGTDEPDAAVEKVGVGLSASVSALHAEVRKQKWFGEATFIQEALSAWPVTDTLAGFPFLDSVDFSFAGHEVNAPVPAGFGLRLDFVDRKGAGAYRKQLECFADLADQPGEKRESIRDWLSRDVGPPGAAAKLAEAFDRLLKEKEASYQRVLSKATHLVQNATLDREWDVVDKELSGSRLKELSRHFSPSGTTTRYLVAENAATTDGGQALDLIVELETGRIASRTAPTREVVSQARALFRAEVQKSYKQVVDEARFGKDSAVHGVLLHEKVATTAETLGLIDTVEVAYDVIAAEQRYGFDVKVDLTACPGEPSTDEKDHSFTVSSELDPPQRGRWSELVRDFVSRDLIGNVVYYSTTTITGTSKGTLTLWRKGGSWFRKRAAVGPQAVSAYGRGDFATLPADTRAIDVDGREFGDDDLALLARFTNLEVLDLGALSISDDGLRHLAALKKLRSLTLGGENLTGTGLRRLVDLPDLRELSIYPAELTDQGIAALAGLKQLTYLSLSWTKGLTDRQVGELSKLTELRDLHLSECDELTDIGVRHIAKLANLELLSISRAGRVTSAGIAELAALKELVEIDLAYLPLAEAVTDELARIRRLEFVHLRGLDVTVEGLHALAKSRRLQRLAVYESKRIAEGDEEKLKALLPGEFDK